MKISSKALLALVVLGGLLAFSIGIRSLNVFAEDVDPSKPMAIERQMGSLWNYQTTCNETAEAVVSKDGKETKYTWETETTSATALYFGEYDESTDKWEILKSTRDTSKLLKSYMAGDKDLKASKEPFFRMFDGPDMYIGPADFMGHYEVPGTDNEKRWDDAVINNLPLLYKPELKSGDKIEGKVVVGGKEVGSYSANVSGFWVESEMTGGKIRDYYIRGTLNAKRDDGRTIHITGYTSKWEEGCVVPMLESWKVKIEYTKDNTKYTINRDYERQTLGSLAHIDLLNTLDITRMGAVMKAFKVGYAALMASNLTAETLQNQTASREKVVEAGTSYFEAYRQWPAGPFAEPILLWCEDLNLLTRGAVMGAKVGSPAPPIQVNKWYNSKPIPASEYVGKVVIVERFFPNCGPCRQMASHMAQLYNKYNSQGLIVVGLTKYEYSADNNAGPYTIEDIISKFGATYPIAADAPTFVLFDMYGNLMRGPDRKYIMVERSTTSPSVCAFTRS